MLNYKTYAIKNQTQMRLAYKLLYIKAEMFQSRKERNA